MSSRSSSVNQINEISLVASLRLKWIRLTGKCLQIINQIIFSRPRNLRSLMDNSPNTGNGNMIPTYPKCIDPHRPCVVALNHLLIHYSLSLESHSLPAVPLEMLYTLLIWISNFCTGPLTRHKEHNYSIARIVLKASLGPPLSLPFHITLKLCDNDDVCLMSLM